MRLIAVAISSCILTIALNLPLARLAAQNPQTIPSIQQGIELYQKERYRSALQVWNATIAREDDALSKSFILSNMALAYQKLGDRTAADRALAKALQILDKIDRTSGYSIRAKALNTKGYLHWLRGNFAAAITAWDRAIENYLQVEDGENVFKCQLNQAKALQASGFSSKARAILEQIEDESKQIENVRLKATRLQYLGNILRKVGDFQRSEAVLKESLSLIDSADTLLELGNTERALSDNYLATDRVELANKYAERAIANYQQAFSLGNLQAGLNQLSLAIPLGKWSDIALLIPKLERGLVGMPHSRMEVYSRLNLIHSLSCLQEIDQNNFSCVSQLHQDRLKQLIELERPALNLPSLKQIAKNLQAIIHQAEDSQTKSYAVGELGKLYEGQQQWELAEKYTQQALLILEGIDTPEIRYRWQWQLGRILKQQAKIPEAIAAYSAAVDNLKSVRSDLLVFNTEAQFSFRDNIEPIYRELVDLLLIGQVSQDNLELAIQSIDTLQLAEVENFLNCDLGSSLQLKLRNKNLDDVDARAGFIYPIILKDRLEVIFKLPGQPLRHHPSFVTQETIKQTLRELKRAIVRGYPERETLAAGVVYNWLIAPLEPYLAGDLQVDTLVFVLDGELRNIPMGVLYDSSKQEYLIQKPYALALLPSFQVFDLQTKSPKLQVLGAGISERLQVENKSFAGLNVTEELDNIKNIVSSSILLNSQFTETNIQQNLDRENFSVIHLATHGNFSSNPEDTYLLIYADANQGSLLKARDLDKLLRQSKSQQPLDLLVLSACETAEGDNRATLGLAGLAVRAGTRSTLASLWQVNDRSTVKLMERFYRELSTHRVSKALALQRAQQELLNDPQYRSPYYWSSYVLVGNWR